MQVFLDSVIYISVQRSLLRGMCKCVTYATSSYPNPPPISLSSATSTKATRAKVSIAFHNRFCVEYGDIEEATAGVVELAIAFSG